MRKLANYAQGNWTNRERSFVLFLVQVFITADFFFIMMIIIFSSALTLQNEEIRLVFASRSGVAEILF